MNIRSRLSGRAVRIGAAAMVLGVVAGSAAAVSATVGGGGDRDGGDDGGGSVRESLSGYEETPQALSTSGHGKFRATITDEGISYMLAYDALEGNVTQAHIHFGATGQTGGISAYLCSNVGGPAGTQACPAAPAMIMGTITAANVIGPAGQGIAATEYDELLAAIRAGTAYVNVHSDKYTGGEIRAQIEHGHSGHH